MTVPEPERERLTTDSAITDVEEPSQAEENGVFEHGTVRSLR